ncbi:hypothetical protein HC248_03407 [Polaromonas vacuolata]|uniref:Uncharacterized protein n=1 Tax=Polaromonas vacuolata TaxID=37448 RepID=A0A6H2HE15_9BURK|nr:hypothetical protein HC248_03407 [Polaromonas vacuolata]
MTINTLIKELGQNFNIPELTLGGFKLEVQPYADRTLTVP